MNILIAEDNRETAKLYCSVLKSRGHNVAVASDGLECLQLYKNMSNNVMARNKERGGEGGEHLPTSSSHYEKDDDVVTRYDVVILDYRMPKLDGLEAAKAILKINPKQRIIFASAYVRETLHDSVKDLQQIVELIEKPFEPKTLVELVENTYTSQELTKINTIIRDMDNEQATISGEDILKGFKRMNSIFGDSVLNVLIEEAKDRGIVFEQGKRYSAGYLQSLLKSMLGDHAGVFLMRFFTGYFGRESRRQTIDDKQ